MVIIQSQHDFDELLVKPAANKTLTQNQIIRIYPMQVPYVVSAPIVITQSNVIIEGYGRVRPTLQYQGAAAAQGASGILHFKGASGAELENLIVANLILDGVDKSKTSVSGIFAEYCGLAQTAGLAAGGYDSSTVGKDKPNKIGIAIRNCFALSNADAGIYLVHSANSSITNNVADNNKAPGVYLNADCRSCMICGNKSIGSESDGIRIYSTSNSVISANSIRSNSGTGIGLNSSSNNTVSGNTAQGNSVGITLSSSFNNSITGNIVSGNASAGLSVSGGSKNTVVGNILSHGGMGVAVSNSGEKTIIEGNIISQPSTMDYYIKSSGNYSLILGNQMSGAGTGITMSGAGSKQQDNIKG